MSYCADSGSGCFLAIPIPVIHCHPKSERGFMQIYTENRFCLPLFYLIVLGVALSVLSCPDKAFAEDASSGVHEGQPRQAPKGLPPSLLMRLPNARPSPRSRPMTAAGSTAACSPCRCLKTSPPNSSRPHSPSCARPNPVLRSFISNCVKRLRNFITFLSRPTPPLTPSPSSGASSSACVPRPYGNCSAFPHKWKSSPGSIPAGAPACAAPK